MRLRTVLPLLGIGAILTACDGGPKAGDLTFVFGTGVQQQVGAVSFEVRALEPNTVDTVMAACAGCQIYTRRVSDMVMRGIVVGTISPGPLVTATVSDRGKPTLYSGRVIEAAATDYTALGAAQFQLTLQQ